MRPALRALAAGGLGFAVSLIAACGSSRVLSSDQASVLSSQLDQVQTALNNGDCTGAASALNRLSLEIGNVSNATARTNLTQGLDKLDQLARQECPVSTPSTTTTTTKTTAPTTTHTTPTVTTHTQTAPATSTATTPTNSGTTTSAGSGGAGIGPGNSGTAPGHNKSQP